MTPDSAPKKPNFNVKKVEAIAIGTDVQARLFTLAPADVIPWHHHSESTDHYFVLRGALTIETRHPDRSCRGASSSDAWRLFSPSPLPVPRPRTASVSAT